MGLLGRRTRYRFRYNVTIHEVSNLTQNGALVFVKWKRGKKPKNKGETKKVLVNDGYAFWHENISFNGTLYRDHNGRFKKKQLHLELMMDSEKKRKPSVIGKAVIDLHDPELSSILYERQKQFLFPIKVKKGEASLKIAFHSECLSDYNADEGMSIVSEGTTVGETTSNTYDSAADDVQSDERDMDYDHDPGRISPTPASVEVEDFKPSSTLEIQQDTPLSLERSTSFKQNGQPSNNGGPNMGLSHSPPRSPQAWGDNHSVATSSANIPPLHPSQETRNRFAAVRNSQARRRQNLSSSDYSFSPTSNTNNSFEAFHRESPFSSPRQTAMSFTDEDDTNDLVIEEALQILIQHLVASLQRPYFVNGMPVTATVFFRVLKEWNCFTGQGDRETLKQVVLAIDTNAHLTSEEVEKQCYWFVNCLVLLYLTRTHCQYVASAQEKRHVPQLKLPFPKQQSYFGEDEEDPRPLRIPKSFPAFALEHIKDAENALVQFRIDISRIALRVYGGLLAKICEKLSAVLIPSLFEIKCVFKGENVGIDRVKAILQNFLEAFEDAFVPKEISLHFFHYVYSFIDAHVFNTLCVDKDLCTMKFAIPLKTGISELEWWAAKHVSKETKDALKHIRQASDILILTKDAIQDPVMREDVWPDLAPSQARKLLENHQPDAEFGAEPVPSSVLNQLEVAPLQSVLLDVSFVQHPNLHAIEDMDAWHNVPAPESIRTNALFSWLS